MPAPTQEKRHAAIETKLGKDKLLLKSVSGREELGRLFEYHAVLLDATGDVDGNALVGTNVSVRIQLEDGGTRYLNGYVCSVAFLGYDKGMGTYHAEIVPWLWLLTKTSDCRIFQEKTVQQIIEECFREHGFEDFKFELRRSYQKRVFCVQYNETTFNFVSRLMEHEGIYYYWKHENGKHTMYIVDGMAAHVPHPNRGEIEWRPHTGLPQDGYLYDLKVQKSVSTGKFAHSDYNFKKPKEDLRKKIESEKPHAASKFELFEFPGQYREAGEGDALAKVRLEEAQAQQEMMEAMVMARAVSCGYFLKLKKAERRDTERRYLITATNLTITEDDYTTGGGSSGHRFECHVSGIPDSTAYRPARLTGKPYMRGPQMALVVGPGGEEIYVDEHGRIKVHFYWDRRSEANEKSSKWVRVAQPAAGGGYGFTSWPRIGQEVIVDFIAGDPDRPIVRGCVYNGENKVPYSLPGEKTKTVWKSNSSKGGGGYNELRFEDSKDSEQIFMHGQKDLDIRIENDARTLIVSNNDVTIGANSTTSVGSNVATTIGSNHTHTVGANQHVTVGGEEAVDISGNSSKNVGGDTLVNTGMNLHEEAGMGVYIKGGMKVVIEAGATITLKVGGNHVTISPAGVAIVGTMVLINSGGAAASGTSVSKKKPEKAKKPAEAKNSSAGQVEKSKGMGHASNPQTWQKQTVHDHAAQSGAPFYGGSGGASGGGAAGSPPAASSGAAGGASGSGAGAGAADSPGAGAAGSSGGGSGGNSSGGSAGGAAGGSQSSGGGAAGAGQSGAGGASAGAPPRSGTGAGSGGNSSGAGAGGGGAGGGY
jgi:type VI secretion system secreted protein VgrG